MGMTQEQKEKCSMIWKGYTGYIIEPHHWNEEAADILAEYVGERYQMYSWNGNV